MIRINRVAETWPSSSALQSCPCVIPLACLALPASAGKSKLVFEIEFNVQRSFNAGMLSQVKIIRGIQDTPAERADLMPTDTIESVDGVPLKYQSRRKFFDSLSGIESGTSVRFVALRDDKPIAITLVTAAPSATCFLNRV